MLVERDGQAESYARSLGTNRQITDLGHRIRDAFKQEIQDVTYDNRPAIGVYELFAG